MREIMNIHLSLQREVLLTVTDRWLAAILNSAYERNSDRNAHVRIYACTHLFPPS
jgi:sensor histidine kinase regulating citrate/malate metabolism